MKLELTSWIQSYLKWLSDKTIVIWFSGWPDSIATYNLILKYYQEQTRDTSKIFLAHFNHKAREESNQEADFIKENYKNTLLGEYSKKSNKEADYRKERHDFFRKCLIDKDTKTLILGHNLTDRLETTLLNIERGAWPNGIGNMEEIGQKEYLLDSQYTILRPLLSFPKFQIIKYCEAHDLKYFIDKTNDDITVSKRNKIRAEIIKPLEQGDKAPLKNRIDKYTSNAPWEEQIEIYELFQVPNVEFREQLQEWYTLFYTHPNSLRFYHKRIHLADYFGFEYLYKINNVLSLDDLIELLKAIHEYGNTTSARLQEYLRFIRNSKSGYKMIWKRKFFHCHGWMYLILENSKENIGQALQFWLQWEYKNNLDQIRTIDLDLDYYKGKPINKYLINNKVPIFVRKFVPVQIDNTGKIIKTLIQPVLDKIHEWLNGKL